MNIEFDDRYTQYQTNRGTFRRFVRQFYLRSAVAQLHGPTLDFGCGVGELLAKLPPGSKGVEYNKTTVAYCRSRGLDVDWYDGYADDWSLSTLPPEWCFASMVVSHVLEHLEDPMQVLASLLEAGRSRQVHQVLVIVPGSAGFSIDSTHKTFVDINMLQSASLEKLGWRLAKPRYFPGNAAKIGDYFVHHELQVMLERLDAAESF